MNLSQSCAGLALVCLLLAGCSSGPRGDAVYAPAQMPAPAATTFTDVREEIYRLLPEDELKITVFRVPDLSGTYRVGTGGVIQMPLIGEVAAVGQTAAELGRQLEQAYGGRYLQDPSIQVEVVKSSNTRFVVEGAVRDPGAFPVDGRTTLLEAVALANGLDPDTANPSRVVVIREISGETYRAAFDLRQVREGLMENPRIYAGDIVVVDGSNLRRDIREIIRTAPLIGLFVR